LAALFALGFYLIRRRRKSQETRISISSQPTNPGSPPIYAPVYTTPSPQMQHQQVSQTPQSRYTYETPLNHELVRPSPKEEAHDLRVENQVLQPYQSPTSELDGRGGSKERGRC
jgi:hypothetical protein